MIYHGVSPGLSEKVWFVEFLVDSGENIVEDFVLCFECKAVDRFWRGGSLHLSSELHLRFEQGSSTSRHRSLLLSPGSRPQFLRQRRFNLTPTMAHWHACGTFIS